MPPNLPDLANLSLDDVSKKPESASKATSDANEGFAEPSSLQPEQEAKVCVEQNAEVDVAAQKLDNHRAFIEQVQHERAADLGDERLSRRSASPAIDIFYPGYVLPSVDEAWPAEWLTFGVEWPDLSFDNDDARNHLDLSDDTQSSNETPYVELIVHSNDLFPNAEPRT
jgi:hypothetical protein